MANGMDGPSDGASLAILSNRLQGVAKKMANTLLRTDRSGVLNIAARLLLLHRDPRQPPAGGGRQPADPCPLAVRTSCARPCSASIRS